MPPLSRWFIKSSFVYLVATFVSGVLAVVDAAWDVIPGAVQVTPVYYHLFMLGWVSQLIFGVGNWMFPVYSREAPRRSERLGWAVYGLLNGGLALLVLAEVVRAFAAEQAGHWLQAVGALLLWLAGTAFVANTWGRIRGK
jgi:heme/copper-type cytochrome/quinol oxidase subunit 1